ncbi:hypothetical protein F4776DRAFT_627088 [Hypoxylon sp. NC0597]|nr:hypothetical protein F4776DRAFT_627088 [Hypoxylon sp. NC0597]
MEATESPELPTQCEKVGEAMPDIAGYGVLIGLSVQALISLVLAFWVFFLTKLGRLDIQHPEGTPEHASEKKRLGFVSEILMVGNDLQMITGTSIRLFPPCIRAARKSIYIICIQALFIGIYPLTSTQTHSISNAAAVVCWSFMKAKAPEKKSQTTPSHWPGHFRVSYMFALLFLGLTIFLEIRLDGWSLTSEELGYCYVTTGITTAGASHPATDKAYVAITAVWLLLVMFGALFCSAKFGKPLLILSFLQFPVHLYMMIRLRSENQAFLEGRENENEWDFGQTTATILLCIAIAQLVNQGIRYLKFERGLKKYGPGYALAQDGEYPEAGTPSLVEQGIRGIREVAKKNMSNARLERSQSEQEEESYELMRNSERRA